jgi:hypothetical protein
VKRLKVIKVAGRVLSLVALVLATPVHGEDDFPLVGTYTENQACKTDGSDPGVSRVKITPRQRMTADRGRLLAWALTTLATLRFDLAVLRRPRRRKLF